MKPMEELASIAPRLPTAALADINSRIGDWLAGGGQEDDPYIKQQLRYAKLFIMDKNKVE
jgi:hypothetical protein